MWRVWVAVFSIGCIGHITLPAPPPTLTAEQRVAWFNSLAGRSERTTWTVQTRTGYVSNIEKTMTIGNGTEITAAEDVLPVVAPDSATAHHARAAQSDREHGDRWRELSIGVLAVALIVAAARSGSNPFEDKWDAAIWGSAAAIGLFSNFAAADSYNHAAKESGLAFESYTKDLADQLQICVLNMQLVPCEYRAPAPATPAAPAPALPPVPAGQSVPDGPVAGR
ncbi:MAG: hypothetical protein ABJE66_20180 [Deltaproteobacteria bacterium]